MGPSSAITAAKPLKRQKRCDKKFHCGYGFKKSKKSILKLYLRGP